MAAHCAKAPLQPTAFTQVVEELGDFYTLLRSSETNEFALQWQDKQFLWELTGSDPSLNVRSFADKNIGQALMLPSAK